MFFEITDVILIALFIEAIKPNIMLPTVWIRDTFYGIWVYFN